jgi:glucose/arabinose dehydrogenase
MLGDTTPPDELNILQQNQNYGWPDCYADKVTDTTQHNKPKEYCATTTAPIHQFHAHNAPLGLTFVNSPYFPPDWQGDLLVSLHGSWNSSVPVGYKIVHLKVSDSTVTQEEDFVTGFINGRAVSGRPVDLEFDQKGNLYVSDDKAGKIYRIFK